MGTPQALQEGLNIVFTDTFFDVVCLLADLDETEIEQWKNGAMCYGLYKHQQILFFILDNGTGLILPAVFNILTLKSKKLARWLIAAESQVHLMLVDKKSKRVEAIRTVVLDQSVAADIRHYLRQQYVRYESAQDIMEKARIISLTYAADKMLQTAAKFNAYWRCSQEE